MDWSLVYPELKGGAPVSRQGVMAQQSQDDKLIRESLSEKLDNILAEAKIDANLERTERQVSAQAGIAENLDSLNRQMLSFKDNLKSLNTIYGGMLSAMSGAR